jgi:hypothetical protein
MFITFPLILRVSFSCHTSQRSLAGHKSEYVEPEGKHDQRCCNAAATELIIDRREWDKSSEEGVYKKIKIKKKRRRRGIRGE